MRLTLLFLTILAFPAHANVISATDSGFALSETVTVSASPARVYAALGKPALWWSKDHTYSGNARNLSLSLKAGGCFCERIPADRATIEHARVVYARPGKAIRLHGALGPLQAEGVTGALTFAITPEGPGSRITMTYVVGGYVSSGAKALAPLVDRVLAQQLDGLKTHLEGRAAQ